MINKTNKCNNKDIEYILSKNKPIEDKLHVIVVISNPCLYKRRYELTGQFIKRMEKEPRVIVYVVELAYGKQKFALTSHSNSRHLQLRTETPLWHKENMINLGVKYLLPSDYKAFAWIDSDIVFLNKDWALDTLKILNGYKDIVQLFEQTQHLNFEDKMSTTHYSAGFQYINSSNRSMDRNSVYYWHPGFAWAITRSAYEKINGLYELAIIGSGDYIMLECLLQNVNKKRKYITGYGTDKYSLVDLQNKMKGLCFGYVPGIIKNFYHGSWKNRKYQERKNIILQNHYDPSIHIEKDEMGIIVPSKKFSNKFKKDIYNYFKERNEDDIYELLKKNKTRKNKPHKNKTRRTPKL